MPLRRGLVLAVVVLCAACSAGTGGRLSVSAGRATPAPPPDADHDGVEDARDACPGLPGMHSAAIALDGCPPQGYYDDGLTSLDHDGDSVLDGVDACPDEPGVGAAAPEANGCPAPPAPEPTAAPAVPDACRTASSIEDARKSACPEAWLEGDRIRVLGSIQFASGRAALLGQSTPTLSAVRDVLATHPEIARLRIEGYTDDRGAPGMNRELSQKRATAVLEWLAGHEISRERLAAEGFGFEDPIAPNDTPEGRARNRRVEFRVTESRPPAELASSAPPNGANDAPSPPASGAPIPDAHPPASNPGF